MAGIRVYFVNDQVGIADATHTAAKFDTVMYDTDGEWDAVEHMYRPKIIVPTIIHLAAHVRWQPPAGAGVGYGKIWTHWKNDATGLSEGHGEGVVDGPVSAANPGIGYADQRLCQPGDYCHVAVWFFNGGGSHAIQAGSGDLPDATPNRSYFAASY